ncbi:hypothetical protein AAEU33_08660 [Chryseobacterium sp. Chry.R1]|uniref:bacteriocin-like protein n=1 Tax=Chryseobacterium sp. Chry.R1 TaxID=3139392 RepID=UPI0031F96440
MKNFKILNREHLKAINGSGNCNHVCPSGPFGPDPESCAVFNAMPECCKARLIELPPC